MIVWIIIIGIIAGAFVARMIVKLRRRKYAGKHYPSINTPKKRFRFTRRFRHTEGLGD